MVSCTAPPARPDLAAARSASSESTVAGKGSRLTTAAVNRWNPPDAGTAPRSATARIQVQLSHAASRSASAEVGAAAT